MAIFESTLLGYLAAYAAGDPHWHRAKPVTLDNLEVDYQLPSAFRVAI